MEILSGSLVHVVFLLLDSDPTIEQEEIVEEIIYSIIYRSRTQWTRNTIPPLDPSYTRSATSGRAWRYHLVTLIYPAD